MIADVFDGQSFSAYGYVRGNPLALTDPGGFEPERLPIMPIAGREWTVPSGEIVVDLLYPPREGQQQKTLPPFDGATTIGAVVQPVDVSPTGPGAGQTSSEGIGSFFEGLLMGGLANNDSVSATIGGIVGGLIPGVGLVADIRDFGAAVGHVASGKEGAWLELGASVIGFVPGGDIAKSVAKGITKGTTKGAAKVASEAVQEAAKVARGSTIAAADTVSNAQKAVKGVQATPRGPPAKRPGTRGHDDHCADVEGGGNRQAIKLARPGEKVVSEGAIRGHTGINRRADNQIVGTNNRTRLVVES